MAQGTENYAKTYESAGLIDTYKAYEDAQKVLNQVEEDLQRGFTRNLDSPKDSERGKRLDLPQFSETRTQFLTKQKELSGKVTALKNILENKSKTYVATPGPKGKIVKEEERIAGLFRPTAVKTTGVPTGVRASTATTGTETNAPVTTTVTPTITTTGTTTSTTKKGKKTPAPAVTQDNWVDALQKFFPSYSDDWLAANAETYFGKDLIDLMIKVSDPKGVYDLTTAAGVERIQQEIRGTNYWQTTITATKNFDQLIDADKQNLITNTKSRIANTYGDIGLDEQTLTAVAGVVARTGLTGLGEKQAVYNAVFKQGAPQAQTGRALSGADADRLKKLGRAYNFNVTDDQIQSILTGTPEASTGVVLTEEGLRQRLQKYVKGAMPQIADQIDAGLSLEDIGGNYRRYAAALLERSEDEIDMFQGPYLEAFGTKETGQLSLTEWNQKVKSDPKFGWQYTKQANDQATDIALTLARAFGKVQ
jgi:hypothetical protein